jgi:catechol 2,3-dioxygenase-like lactoylglutathione lyase family enzyme
LITAIDHIQISAPKGSEARVRAFYGGVLGLKEIPKPPQLLSRGGVWYDCGNLQLHIGMDDAPDNERLRRHVAFRVDDLSAVRQRLIANALPIEEDQAPLEGVQRFYCRDSVGNRVEFVQPLTAANALSPVRPQGEPQLIEEYVAQHGVLERIALSPDGHWLAAGTSAEEGEAHRRPNIFVWRFGNTLEPEVQIEMSAPVWELAFSPDGKELACLSEDGSLETWRVGDFESADFAELPKQSAGLAYSPDGQLLAVGAGSEAVLYRPGLRVWHTLRPSGLGLIRAVAFDSHAMVAISGEALFIQLWQLRPIQQSAWELRGHEAPIVQMQSCPEHAVLAAVTEHGDVLLWDLNGHPEEPRFLQNEMSDVNALAFNPDGALLACGSDDGRVWLWDWQAETVLAKTTAASDAVIHLAFTPDGQQLIVGHEGGRIRAWRISA